MLYFIKISQRKLSSSAWYFSGSCDPNNPAIKIAISRLKYDNIESWPEILHSWSVTHPLRFEYLKKTRPISQQTATSSVRQSQKSDAFVNNYLKNWGVLALPNGYLLVRKLNALPPFLISSFSNLNTPTELICRFSKILKNYKRRWFNFKVGFDQRSPD